MANKNKHHFTLLKINKKNLINKINNLKINNTIKTKLIIHHFRRANL